LIAGCFKVQINSSCIKKKSSDIFVAEHKLQWQQTIGQNNMHMYKCK